MYLSRSNLCYVLVLSTSPLIYGGGLKGKKTSFSVSLSDLLEPLIPCQFISHDIPEDHKKPKNSPVSPMASKLIAFVMEAGGMIQIIARITRFQRRDYVLKHQRICLVHLNVMVYKGPSYYGSYGESHRLHYDQETRSSVNWHMDMVLIFKDGTKDWGPIHDSFSLRRCETPVTFIEIEMDGANKIGHDPVLILTRARDSRSGPRPHVSLYSSSSLNVQIIALPFEGIVEQVRRVRTNFFGLPILLRRFGLGHLPGDARLEPKDIRKNRKDRTLQENRAVPFLELGFKFNFSVQVKEEDTEYLSQVGLGDEEAVYCERGQLLTGTIERTPSEQDSGDEAKLYNIFYQQVESIRVIYVTDLVKPSSPILLTTTGAPFKPQLWLLTAAVIAAVATVFSILEKSRRRRWDLIYYSTVGTPMLQGPSFSGRTAKFMMLWTIVVFFLSSHYLALLQSFIISPELVVDKKTFGQLEKEGYKFWMDPKARTAALGFHEYLFEDKKSKLLAKDNLLLSTLIDDKNYFSKNGHNTPFRSVLDKKAALAGWNYELEVIIKELQQEAQNVHLLDDEYLRFVVWYGIYMHSEDVVMEGFQLLIATGIVEYWKQKAVEIQAVQLKEEFAREIAPASRNSRGAEFQCPGQGLYLNDLLILEPFAMFGAGMLVTTVVCVIRAVMLFRARRKVGGRTNVGRAEECNGGCGLRKICDEIEGLCPNCKDALKWRLQLTFKTHQIKPRRAYRRSSY